MRSPLPLLKLASIHSFSFSLSIFARLVYWRMCTTDRDTAGQDQGAHLIDFAKTEQGYYEELVSIYNELDIGVLRLFLPFPRLCLAQVLGGAVNNVGKSHAMPVYFVDTSPLLCSQG
jgi:hypothetical protein